MTEQECLITCLAEECCELAQAILKMARFGPTDVWNGETNVTRINREFNDVIGAATQLHERTGLQLCLPAVLDPARIAAKQAKVAQYVEYSRKLGIVEESSGQHLG